MVFLLLLVLSVLVAPISAYYSISYYFPEGAQSDVLHAGLTFAQAPDAKHVADLYTRLSDLPRLARQDIAHVPELRQGLKRPQPVLLEINGGILPSEKMTSVVKSSAFPSDQKAPALKEVTKVLREAGHKSVKSKSMNGEGEDARFRVRDWLASQDAPVIVLHHETPSIMHVNRRRLSSSNTTMTPAEIAMAQEQISYHHVLLWTTIGIVITALMAISYMANMEVVPDSILYARFTSGRTNKND